jgi:formylglycine-generating enzyme required for sulfatase activity
VSGNVFEMCFDFWIPALSTGKVQDPVQEEDTEGRLEHVCRGGGWNHDPATLRGGRRDVVSGKSRHKAQGFRCVRTKD